MKASITAPSGADIRHLVHEALKALSLPAGVSGGFSVEFPAEMAHGDYSTNVAMVLAKEARRAPRELAEQIALKLRELAGLVSGAESVDLAFAGAISRVDVAGPGFINFHISRPALAGLVGELASSSKAAKAWGKTARLSENGAPLRYVVEYTDPNPFKVLHIGHMMSNAIGESLARLVEAAGAETIRANYQGDVGIHVAKAVYGMALMKTEMPSSKSDKKTRAGFLGNAYALGARLYEKDDETKAKIQEVNRLVYAHVNGERLPEASPALSVAPKDVARFYDLGRKWSLEAFEDVYERLGTAYDHYFFESQTGPRGLELVKAHLRGAEGVAEEDAVFDRSEGAIVFRGEDYGLHTRVFVNKDGLPTYEAKELGLAEIKYEKTKFDRALVVTANEIVDYFKVLVAAIGRIRPDLAPKILHVPHGMMKLPTGKMSSRTGDVISAEGLIDDVGAAVRERKADLDPKTVDQIAVGALKYIVLRQAPGRDVVLDKAKAVSFEGDSGPYLQYSAVRARSVVEKAAASGVKPAAPRPSRSQPASIAPLPLERLIARFPDVAEHAALELSPNHVATYLIELASAFNSYYAQTQILDGTPEAPYKVALAAAVYRTLENGLSLLGIETPKRM